MQLSLLLQKLSRRHLRHLIIRSLLPVSLLTLLKLLNLILLITLLIRLKIIVKRMLSLIMLYQNLVLV